MAINNTLKARLAGLIVAIIFGFSFMFTAQALKLVTPIELLGLRFGVAAITMTIVVYIAGYKFNLSSKKKGPLFLVALFQPVIYFICETIGVKLTSSSQAGMMVAVIPIFVAIVAAIFLKERTTGIQWFFIIFSVSGVFFIVLMSPTHAGNLPLGGMLALLGAVIAGGTYTILARKLANEYEPIELTFCMMWAGAIVFNAIAGIIGVIKGEEGYWTSFTELPVFIAVVYLGIISSIIAFFLINYMFSKIPATQGVVFDNLTTVVAIIAGTIFLHETFTWYQGIGALAILIGVWGTNHFSPTDSNDQPVTQGD